MTTFDVPKDAAEFAAEAFATATAIKAYPITPVDRKAVAQGDD